MAIIFRLGNTIVILMKILLLAKARLKSFIILISDMILISLNKSFAK